ncbi:hypothetical protein AWN76_011705 [Rhodothermaceae bacterium RA]|nr:hypothetical protein AWN76_011705 [Rhodothermaceae bacterium RA]
MPQGQEIFRFSGSYSVSADTVSLALDKDCSLLQQSRWIFEEGMLRYAQDPQRGFQPIIELVQQ